MAEPFTGEIKMFGFIFAPRSWSPCNGQLMAINDNTALFSLLGTTYGGDGRATFGIPEMRGRSPLHWGAGPGLYPRQMGQFGGYQQISLTLHELPTHNHTATFAPSGAARLEASPNDATSDVPTDGAYLGKVNGSDRAVNTYVEAGQQGDKLVDLAGIHGISGGNVTVNNNGSGNPFPNEGPFMTVNFCIALQGLYPPRN